MSPYKLSANPAFLLQKHSYPDILSFMKLKQLINVLQSIAPEHLAESWDKVGLHVENTASIKRALLCIDLTQSVLEEAIDKKANLIVSYHPPIFSPLTALTTSDYKQNIILTAARKNIAIYSPHTALDASPTGVNQFLARGIALDDNATISPIRPATQSTQNCKLVVFVPAEHVPSIRTALASAGAGKIGQYSECSFELDGHGTFRGSASSHPAVGKPRRFERAREIRLEMVIPQKNLSQAISLLRSVHPYEEPAFDIYPLIEEPQLEQSLDLSKPQAGQGRIIQFARPISLATLTQRIKDLLHLEHLNVAPAEGVSTRKKTIQRVGLCAGAGHSLLEEAGPLDAFFTGEMRHHDILAAACSGTAIVFAGHTRTERPFLRDYRSQIKKAGASSVDWLISRMDRSPDEIM